MKTHKALAPLVIYERQSFDGTAKIAIDTDDLGGVRLGTREFWLDGSAIIAGVAVSDSQDLLRVLPQSFAVWTIPRIADWWASNSKNPCALYIIDHAEEWAACLPDPLGGALAFHHERSTDILISTQIGRIVSELNNREYVPHKSISFQIEKLIFGNGGLNHSSYEDIKTIEPFEYIVVERSQLRLAKYKIFDNLRQLSRYELFDILREDLQTSVLAISKSNADQRISHLTGGFDSRLVLSSILDLGLKDEFVFFCSGPEGSTDRIIADGLSRRYGLVRSSGAGLTNAPTNIMSERLMGALFDSNGITNTGPQGREINVNVSAMGGGYGEILRTFYGNRKVISDEGNFSTDLLLKEYIPESSNVYQYINPLSVEHIKSLLINKFTRLSKLYSDSEFLGDAYYTHVRNRYHIGQSSLLWSRVGARYDPLYSVAGYCLAANSTQRVRTSNVMGFDLMESMQSDLLSLPFDYDRHNTELSTLRVRKGIAKWSESKSSISFADPMSPSVSKSSPFLGILDNLNVSEHSPSTEERRSLVKKANAMGANYWQVAYQSSGQELLSKAYEQTSSSELFDHIDSNYVEKLFSKNDLNRTELRELYNLGSTMTWLSFGQ